MAIVFGIGLAISFVFVSMAFLVHDISDAWKSMIRTARSYVGRLGRKRTPLQDGGDQPDDISTWILRDNKPGTAGAASTAAYRSYVEDVEWKRDVLDGPDNYTLRMSRDRDCYDHARLQLSPL
ncbi:hypothetical protein F5883DRAFT_654904 [Diaporthe sp. PMI_573]|nr:hypothetical protein F5883DRAFT_654904 [Diaporthaceae sp. PMI_573]